MADDSKVRLWREPPSSCAPERWRSYKVDEFQEEWIARPVADDEARERDRDEWRARAEKAEARCRQIAQRIIDRIGAVGPENAEEALDRLFRCDHTNAITLKRTDEARCAATARAERAEAERDELRARLDAARGGAS